MATIDIRRPHGIGVETAKQRAAELAKDLESKLGIKWRWEGDQILFAADSGAAKGTSGKLSCSGAEVRVEIDLPLLLRAIKGKIAGKVNEKLDALLG
ncbi:MAG: polyhydroxyalkanoic acid system family protein [Deltaproteobacteria bacterium]|nr:polyhydroxyalkanoic acid system family protein [Deltaproteobacteria bacterium]